MKKKLTVHMHPKDFKSGYFTVAELRQFCQANGLRLRSDDRKGEISRKIEYFLETGLSTMESRDSKTVDAQNRSFQLSEKLYIWRGRELAHLTCKPMCDEHDRIRDGIYEQIARKVTGKPLEQEKYPLLNAT